MSESVDFTDFLLSVLNDPKPRPEFTPQPYYIPEGDVLTFFTKDESSYCERVNGLISIYKSLETDELIGCEVKGIRRHIENFGDLGIQIESANLKLSMFFTAVWMQIPSEKPKVKEISDVLELDRYTINVKELIEA